MSYDLYLTPNDTLSLQDFCQFFSSRGWYTVNAAQDGSVQAWYENEDTGTYFSFDFLNTPDEGANTAPEDMLTAPVAFNMNYFRPHVFGLEAVQEVRAFIEHFNCAIDDPQLDGMGTQFTDEGFLRGWNEGNGFGFQSILQGAQDKDAGLENISDRTQRCKELLTSNGCIVEKSAVIEEVWRWNVARREIQDHVQDHLFVPAILWLQDRNTGNLCRCVAWSSGVPILIPSVTTHVVLGIPQKRKQGFLARTFGRKSQSKPDVVANIFIDLSFLKSVDGLVPWACDNFQGTVFEHGPEHLPQALLDKLLRAHLVPDMKERLTFHQGGALRNAELIDDTLNAA